MRGERLKSQSLAYDADPGIKDAHAAEALGSGPKMKPRPNHREYLQVLRTLSPEARLRKAFELSAFSRELFLHGLRRRFPNKSEAEVREIERARVEKCRNRRY
jgi:hypothetical protein